VGLSSASFQLDDGKGGSPISNTKVFYGGPAGDGYSISELVPNQG
jgi:hypothetical protein